MSTFKKLLALSLALAMVLSFSVFAADYKDDTYKDAANIDKDCAGAIELMYALDIMKGDANGNFNPTATITRAEIAKMIYVVLNKGNDDQAVNYKYNQMFNDVPGNAWYAGYVNYCAATKLIDGFNGKFMPLQPVTTAQAAKMLLTAIGYSSAERNYTGANWERNVLSDASIVGLLEDYNYPTNQNAPRQWVAVMFENMLLNAYTYTTVRPGTASGLLTGSMGEIHPDQYKTMGEKYFDLAVKTGYLFATDEAYIDVVTEKSGYAGAPRANHKANGNSGYDAIFASGSSDEWWIHVGGAGLGYMDLGQQYRVIWDTDSEEVYSVRPTGKSVVGDAMLKDITSVVNRKTSGNDSANKYLFTIGDLEATFNSAYINHLTVNTLSNTDTVIADRDKKQGYTPNDLYKVEGDLKTDDYRAVDKDGDGDIDYMIIKEYTYGQVTKVGTHRDYGEYFQAITPEVDNASGVKDYKVESDIDNGKVKLDTNWYLDDIVNTESAIEKDNAIKVCYNPDKGEYDVEVLPVNTGDYTKRSQDQKKAHTLGGEEYFAAQDGFENPYISLISKNLKDELTYAYDDNLVVLVGQLSSNITDLDEINAQLVLVTNAYLDLYSNGNNRLFIDYMTIDGEMHEEVRYDNNTGKAAAEDFYNLLDNGTRVGNNANGDVRVDPNGNLTGSREFLKKHQRLFALKEVDDGVYLIKLTPDDVTATENSQDVLNYADSLLSGYEEAWDKLDGDDAIFGHNHNKADENTKYPTSHNESDFVAENNKFFVSFDDSDDPMDRLHQESFAVMTLNEMGDGTDYAFIQGLYLEKRASKTQLAGHIYGELGDTSDDGYLFTTDDGAYEIDDGEWYLDNVTFENGKEAEEPIRVTMVNGDKITEKNQVEPNRLYSYVTKKNSSSVKYELTLIDERDNAQDTKGNETFRFTCEYEDWKSDWASYFDPNSDKAPAAAKSELINILSTKKIVTSGDGTIALKNSDITIALKTVTLDRDEDQIVGYTADGEAIFAFDKHEKIDFITYNELVEEDEDGVSVNKIYNNDPDQNNDTYEYYSDLYWKVNDDGDIVALYVVVYEVMIQANWN